MSELRNIQITHGRKVPGTHGDIWPVTWADDDAIYSAASDTKGCPEGLFEKGRNLAIVRNFRGRRCSDAYNAESHGAIRRSAQL